jgi:hypothetical protein
MTIFVGLLAAGFTIVAAGFGVAMLLLSRRPAVEEYFALSWLFGTATVSLGLWLGGFFARGILLQLIVCAISISLGAVGFRRWRVLAPRDRQNRGPAVEIIFWGLFLLELAAIFWLSFQNTLGWDGLTVWEMKARYAFLNGGVLTAQYFSDVARRFSHPEYPLLLPLTETWFYLWIGDCDQFWIKLIFPIWYAAAVSILLLVGSELSGKRAIGWVVVLLFPLVPAIHGAAGGIEVGYADVPLAAIYLAATFYFLRLLCHHSHDAPALFVGLAATLPWMKREGAILWGAISVFGAILIWRRRNLTAALLSFFPGGALIAIWRIFLHALHAVPSRDFNPISAESLAMNFGRSGAILRNFFVTLRAPTLWNGFWLLVLVALVCVLARRRRVQALVLIWLLLSPLPCYYVGYILSAWPDYLAHMDTSLPRLLIQLTPMAWLLIALAIAPQTDSLHPNKVEI